MPTHLNFPSILRLGGGNRRQSGLFDLMSSTNGNDGYAEHQRRDRISSTNSQSRPRSMNAINVQDREKGFSSPLKSAKRWSKRLSINFNEKSSDLKETKDQQSDQHAEHQERYEENNSAEEQKVIVEDTVTAKLIANDGVFIYRPGQCLMGEIAIEAKQKRMSTLKKIVIRVQGVMVLSRYESDETRRSGRSIFQKKWHFYDSKPMTYTNEELKELGIHPTIRNDDNAEHEEKEVDGERQTLQMPFAFELPLRCISYKHQQKFIREPALLPPTLQFEIEKDQLTKHQLDLIQSNQTNLDKDLPAHPFIKQLKEFKTKVYKGKNQILRASVRYTLNISVEWQENFFLFRSTKLRLPFLVQPLPPNSTSFIHSVTNRHSRQILHLPPERNHSEFSSAAGNGLAERGLLALDEFAVQSTSRPNSRQSQTRRSNGHSTNSSDLRESRRLSSLTYQPRSWTDLILKETQRGPQAWIVHHLYKRIETFEQIGLEFSYPATAALEMDKQIPFSLSIGDFEFEIDSQSITLTLLRTIQSVSPSGKVIFEDCKPQRKWIGENSNEDDKDSKSIIRIQKLQQLISNPVCTPPPADEYVGMSNLITSLSDQNSQNGLEGELVIESGLEGNEEMIKKGASVTSVCLQNSIRKQNPIHPCFQPSNQDKITIPSFSFRGLCVEYHLELNFNLIRKGVEENDQKIVIQLKTPSIKLASSTKQSSSLVRDQPPPRPGNGVAEGERRTLLQNHLEDSSNNNLINQRPNTFPRRSNLAIESVLERLPPLHSNERQQEWNAARQNQSSNLMELNLPCTTRHYPRRPPLPHRSGPSNEITDEMILVNSTTRANEIELELDPQPPRYRSNSDIPAMISNEVPHTLESIGEDGIFHNEDQQGNSTPILSPQTESPTTGDELYEILDIDHRRQTSPIPTTTNNPLPPTNLERILNNIPSQRSLRSIRTIDGPAPPYLGTLQDA